MSLSQPFGTLTAPKPVLFEDITPGSRIQFAAREDPTTVGIATVIETRREYGPNALPALIIRPEGAEDITILFSNGFWLVEVLEDARTMAAGGDPEEAVTLLPKPVPRTAVRFTGGLAQAERILRWAGGKAMITWHNADAGDTEHLVIHTLEGPVRVDRGTYVVRDLTGHFYPLQPDVLAETYDIEGAENDA